MLPENCSANHINSGWSINIEATPIGIFNHDDHNKEIWEAGELAISNARRALDDSDTHRGETARYLLENFDSGEDPDVEIVIFAKNETIRTRLNKRERESASKQQRMTNGHGKTGVMREQDWYKRMTVV